MIKQFSASFDKIQDRLLLRFNTTQDQEFSFWITRRKVIDFLQTMPRNSEQSKEIISKIENSAKLHKQKYASGTETSSFSSNIEKNEKISEINIKKQDLMPEFKRGSIFPTGEQAVLVKELQCKLVKKTYSIQFYLENNKKVNFSLSLDTFLSLHSLLEMTAKKADWNINDRFYSEKITNLTMN